MSTAEDWKERLNDLAEYCKKTFAFSSKVQPISSFIPKWCGKKNKFLSIKTSIAMSFF